MPLTRPRNKDLHLPKDDFTAKVNGYVLRAEQMNKRTWWWQVYYPDGSEANPDCDLDLPSERVAKSICEIIYRLHAAQSR